jgi:predicted MPP superfamily phosphohydrolase
VTAPLFAFFSGGIGWRRYPTAAFRLWVVRPALYGQLLLPVVTVCSLLGLVAGAIAGNARAGGQIGAAVSLLVSAAVLFAGWLGSRSLVVREVEVRVPGLPAPFDGFRIVQASDLHLGPQTSRHFMSAVTKAIRTLSPDLVAVTGDLIDDRAEDTRLFAEWLATLGVPPHGVYLIPGNHDVYAGWNDVHASLVKHTSAHVLVNDSQTITRGGAALALIGLGDPAARGGLPAHAASAAPDVTRAFSDVPRGVPVVAFAHNPALWPSIAKQGAVLTLSGHTHWGQLALPRLGWSLASPFLKHAMGAYQEGDALLYVHPGTGFWGIPFRLGAYPEVALITLRVAEAAGITMGEARRAKRAA